MIEGPGPAVERFLAVLRSSPPPLARVDELRVTSEPALGTRGFVIGASRGTAGGEGARAPVDVAPCGACLRELADPSDRRYRYPFINCVDCGPRFSIVEGLPYDRERTTMQHFHMCSDCAAEYATPTSRRFHAQPNACARCGPTLALRDGGRVLRGEAALERAIAAVAEGAIVAVRGVGGFHLACDATRSDVVARLRARKRRGARPFAILAREVAMAERYAFLDESERGELASPRRPILLVRRRSDGDGIAPEVAPGLDALGLLLPPTPLHALLVEHATHPWVLTSGNLADEPIARDDAEAESRLATVADVFLTHDRPIAARLDDSVVRVERGVVRTLRRARGLVPDPVPLAAPWPLLAVGADLKSTVCLVAGGRAWVSQHLGDLAAPESRVAWREALDAIARQHAIEPERVACDVHPDYASTRFAESLGLPIERVQHHHAHVAACLVEHGVDEPVIGVALDGAGWGDDGAVWGGELLVADRRTSERAGHLRYARLPGGDRAAREPWRMALAWLDEAGMPLELAPAAVEKSDRDALVTAMRRGVSSPWTSSAGRLFDAIAALAGGRAIAQYEGQAAMELEAASVGSDGPAPYPYAIEEAEGGGRLVLDPRPMVRALVEERAAGASTGRVGARFHATFAAMLVDAVVTIARRQRLRTVALAGGWFQNARLAALVEDGLARADLRVLRASRFPVHDGAISLGQAAVAAARGAR